MKPENKVKVMVRSLCHDLGAYHFTITTMGMGESGHPDRVACIDGTFVGIECKATAKQKPTALQAARLASIYKAKGFAFVVDADNFTRFDAILRRLFTTTMPFDTRRALWQQASEGSALPYWR